jgi:hypothetical protein
VYVRSLTLRKVSQQVNIDLTTAFRWRHRFLKVPSEIQSRLKHKVNGDAVLCKDGASCYKTFAKQENIANRRLITLYKQRVIGKEFHIKNVDNYIFRLKNELYGLMVLKQIIWLINLVGGY